MMKTTIDFIDAVKARYSLPSDYALAKFLGFTKTAVSSYRNKRTHFDDSAAIHVAKLLEIEPAFVLACVHAERAKSESEKAAWASIVERFGGLAASVVVGVALFGSPAPAQASPSVTGDNLYYVKSQQLHNFRADSEPNRLSKGHESV